MPLRDLPGTRSRQIPERHFISYYPMSWQACFTLAVLALVLVAMARDVGTPDLLMLGGVIVLAVAGIVKPQEAFAGFSNEATLTVAALFVVVAGLRETG